MTSFVRWNDTTVLFDRIQDHLRKGALNTFQSKDRLGQIVEIFSTTNACKDHRIVITRHIVHSEDTRVCSDLLLTSIIEPF